MPDTEEGRTALGHISQHLAHYRGDVVSNIMGWIRARAPWFEPDAARTFASQFTAREPLPSAERLGKLILLMDAERTELKIKTIRAFDVTKAEMDRRRKEADKHYQQDKRRKAGAKPRSESYSKTEPWVFFDIVRRTWERRGKPMPPPRDANSSAVDRGIITTDETASAPRKAAARRRAKRPRPLVAGGADQSAQGAKKLSIKGGSGSARIRERNANVRRETTVPAP